MQLSRKCMMLRGYDARHAQWSVVARLRGSKMPLEIETCRQVCRHTSRTKDMQYHYVQRGNWQTLPCCITLSLQKIITNSTPYILGCTHVVLLVQSLFPCTAAIFVHLFFFSVLYHPGMWHKDEVDFCVTCPALVLSHTPILQAMDYIIPGFKDLCDGQKLIKILHVAN